jgi:general L-amino acid transport system permease protein
MTDITASTAPIVKPPRAQVGPIAWLRDNLFSSVSSSIFTVLGLALLFVILKGLIQFAVIDATWVAKDGGDCAKNNGACWPFVFAKFGQFMYGTYTFDERWRPEAVYQIGIALLVPLMFNGMRQKLTVLAWIVGISAVFVGLKFAFAGSRFTGFDEMVDPLFLAVVIGLTLITVLLEEKTGKGFFALLFFGVFPVVTYFLLVGGVMGLPYVPTNLWGGMLVTLVVATAGIIAAFPLGVALALGRRSNMPIIKGACVAFIEFVRGVPLITILFMSSVMLPLFLPPGWTVDKLLRARSRGGSSRLPTRLVSTIARR